MSRTVFVFLLEALGENHSFTSSCFLTFPAFLVWWPQSSVFKSSSVVSPLTTAGNGSAFKYLLLHWGHLDNLESSPHLSILKCICKVHFALWGNIFTHSGDKDIRIFRDITLLQGQMCVVVCQSYRSSRSRPKGPVSDSWGFSSSHPCSLPSCRMPGRMVSVTGSLCPSLPLVCPGVGE